MWDDFCLSTWKRSCNKHEIEYGAQDIHTNESEEKNNARPPYHLYPKEIIATHILKLAKFWYNSLFDQYYNIQLSPTFEKTIKYKIQA